LSALPGLLFGGIASCVFAATIVRHLKNIALVGGSGSGKSTVALLLARLYNLNKGSIHFNDSNIMDIAPSALREQIGVVSQEPLLFAGTIEENNY